MLNPEATALSRNTIPEQMEYLKQSFPFLRNFHLTDASTDGKYAADVKMDYYGGIDVSAKDMNGYREYNFQLKVRMPEHGEDLYSSRAKFTMRISGAILISDLPGMERSILSVLIILIFTVKKSAVRIIQFALRI